MPAEETEGYDVILADGTEHLIPNMDGVHTYYPSCPCGPMQAQNVRGPRGNLPTYLHRSIPAPL